MSFPNTVTACISLSHNDFIVGAAVAAGSVQTCLTAVPVAAMTAGVAAQNRFGTLAWRADRYRGGLPLIHSVNGFRLHQAAM